MIWVVFALLGVPLWLVVGALIGALLSRRRAKREPEVFPAKLRVLAGDVAGLKSSWPRRPLLARWVHDVLVVHRGLALARTSALGVARATGSLTAGGKDAVSGLQSDPCLLTLVLDCGASVQLAAPAKDRGIMVGPFAAVLFVDGDEGAGKTVAGP